MPAPVMFNSRDERYKNPFGAVECGAEICFTLRVPAQMGCSAPVMFLRRDGQQARKLPLTAGARQNGTDIFTLTLPCGETGLYFYWFDLWVDYKKLYRGANGVALVSDAPNGRHWPLLVYGRGYSTPKDFHSSVMYQIFPDRFYEGDPDKPLGYNERIYRADKQNEPYFWGEVKSYGSLTQDYFGGDLAGIEKRLPFLYSVGVGWIYLNPIFEAHSNHRYNVADYLNVDPYLGTNEDFRRLCEKAKAFGMKIILDGVFSHTGADSIYFNREGRYSGAGAWQGPQSPYRGWYRFLPDGGYESWWGFDSLPSCEKSNRGFRDFIAGEGGVIDHWMSLGASGFRLDVADELPDDFIAEIRAAVKRHGEENLLIGEVWEDASLKEAYGRRRSYFWGQGLDGVMNYPFRTAILDFLREFDAAAFAETVMDICENYPAPALAASTVHLSTHDTVRAITALAGEEIDGHERNWQSGRRLSHTQYHAGILRMRLAFVMQYTLPGTPCVYYGDEVAMQGYADPFNRAYYDWHSGEDALIPLMIELAALRKSCLAFSGGRMYFDAAQNGLLVYRRTGGGAAAAVAINCSGWPAVVNLLGEEVTVPMLGYAIRTV